MSYNSKYTGEQVENLLDQVASGNAGGGGGGGITVETDPIFSASPAATITEADKSAWSGKQDAISDLATIRSGANKGATAVQPEDLKEEVYIADFTMESLRAGIYNGTNVDCDLQGLVKAMDTNKVILVRESEDSSLRGVRVLNGYAEDSLYFSIVDTSGNILWCEGTDYISSQYIDGSTLHLQSWDDKQDALVSGENIKTINGESIVGSGDMVVGKITYFSEEDSIELSPGVVWMRRGSVVDSVQIAGFASNGKDYEEYAYHFYTGTIADGNAVKLILPDGVKYANKDIFDALESDTYYELSVVRSNGIVKAVLTAFK